MKSARYWSERQFSGSRHLATLSPSCGEHDGCTIAWIFMSLNADAIKAPLARGEQAREYARVFVDFMECWTR